MSEVSTILLMPPLVQYRAYLYRGCKCPPSHLVGINPISTDIFVYETFLNFCVKLSFSGIKKFPIFLFWIKESCCPGILLCVTE